MWYRVGPKINLQEKKFWEAKCQQHFHARLQYTGPILITQTNVFFYVRPSCQGNQQHPALWLESKALH